MSPSHSPPTPVVLNSRSLRLANDQRHSRLRVLPDLKHRMGCVGRFVSALVARRAQHVSCDHLELILTFSLRDRCHSRHHLLPTASAGSNYTPAKRVNTGDGFFFALVIALGIWFAGLIFTLIYSKGATSDFEPIAAVGGVLWATGNMCAFHIALANPQILYLPFDCISHLICVHKVSDLWYFCFVLC